jgi:hypothetical protein
MTTEPKQVELLIKWNKESLTTTASDADSLESLRAALYSLTTVLPEKQKLIFKGKILKEGGTILRDLGVTDVGLQEERTDSDGTG